MPSTLDSTLIPARRLGQLLIEHRARTNMTVGQVARRSTYLSTEDKVVELEQGRLHLSDGQIAEVVDAYGVTLSALVPQRTNLTLDLESLSMAFGRRRVPFARANEATLNDLLTQYLSTVRAMRSLPDNAELSLRDADLRTLSTGLVLPMDDIRVRLHMLMDDRPDEVRERAELLLGRPLIPALGILVGPTGIGSLILAPPTERPIVPRRALPPAPADEPVTARGGASLDDIMKIKEATLELISYDYRRFLPGWDVEFWPSQSDRPSRTFEHDRRVEVYVRPDHTPEDLAHSVAYGLGRAIDCSYNDGRQRIQWLKMRGIDSNVPWLNGDGLDDLTVGAGDFADSFAHWQSGGRHTLSHLAGPPDGEQLNLLSELSFGQST